MQGNRREFAVAVLVILLACINCQTMRGADLPDAPPAKSDSQTITSAEALRASAEIVSKIERLVASGLQCASRRYFDMARSDLREAIAISQQLFGADHPCTRASQAELRHLEWLETLSEQDFTEYVRLCRETINGRIYFDPERKREIADEATAAIKALERLKSPPTGTYKMIAEIRSEALFKLGASIEALEAAKLMRQLILQTEGPQSLLSGAASGRIANLLLVLGDYQESAREYNRACRERIACGLKESSSYAGLCLEAAILFNAFGDERRAMASLNACRKLVDRVTKEDGQSFAFHVADVECLIFANMKQYDELLKKADQFSELATRKDGANSWGVRQGAFLKAWAARNLGDATDAGQLSGTLRKIEDVSTQHAEGYRILVNIYAQLQVELGNPAKAIELLEPKIEAFKKRSEHYSGLDGLLQTYAQALTRVGRVEEAKQAEAQAEKLKARVAEQRKLIESDPLCKFPWES